MDEITEQIRLGKAKEMLLARGIIGTEVLQRELRMGYSSAYRILDLLAEEGLIEQPKGADPVMPLARP